MLNTRELPRAADAPARARPRHPARVGEGAPRLPRGARALRERARAVVTNLHATGSHDKRLPDAEVLRAAWFAEACRAGRVSVLAGDFNVRPPISRRCPSSAARWGFSQPGPGIDHVLVRGAEATPGAPAGSCASPVRRPSALRSRAGGGDGRTLSWDEARAQFPVLERFAYLNAGTSGRWRARRSRRSRRERARPRGGPRPQDPLRGVRRDARARARAASRARRRRDAGARRAHLVDDARHATSSSPASRSARTTRSSRPTREHFGLLGPLGASGRAFASRRCASGPPADALDAILAEVTPRTRLIALSHVLWTTGHVLPVEELSARRGVPLLVDGAQSVGAIPVDASPFDFYTVSGQKWLCGPDATGALYRARPGGAARSRCRATSRRTGYEPDGLVHAAGRAPRASTRGWMPAPSLAGLLAALDAAPDGASSAPREMAARCRELLAERVEVVTEPGHATLVALAADGSRPDGGRARSRRGVIVRDMPGTGWCAPRAAGGRRGRPRAAASAAVAVSSGA